MLTARKSIHGLFDRVKFLNRADAMRDINFLPLKRKMRAPFGITLIPFLDKVPKRLRPLTLSSLNTQALGGRPFKFARCRDVSQKITRLVGADFFQG